MHDCVLVIVMTMNLDHDVYNENDDNNDNNDNDDRPSLLFCLLSLLASYCHGTNYLIKVIFCITIINMMIINIMVIITMTISIVMIMMMIRTYAA